jgi:RNA polymerase sigma factor, sigma-70 family
MNGADAMGTKADLVRLAQLGDRVAFESLVTPEVRRLVRLAGAIVGNEFDARDVVQETLTIAWQRNSTLREADRFQAWLTRILVNESRHAIRRRGRRRVVEQEALGDSSTTNPRRSLEDAVVSQDTLERAFERLDARQRALLVLHHLEERPLSELAFVLNIRPGTVKSQLWNARKALSAALAIEEAK